MGKYKYADYIRYHVKKRCHCVWRDYLYSWTTPLGMWGLRHNKIYHTGTYSIQNKRLFFYLNHLDEQYITVLNELSINKMHPLLKDLNTNWITLFAEIIRLRKKAEQTSNDVEIQLKINDLTYTFEEEFHTKYDTGTIELFHKLYQKDLSFLDGKDYYSFNTYICVQYFWTKARKQSFLTMQKDFPEVDLLQIRNILFYMLATSMAFCISQEGYKHILLENNTINGFITGDQPVVNTCERSQFINLFEYAPFELYYPLTPKLALLITNNDGFTHKSVYQLNENDVNNYNNLIFKNSFEHVFSKEKSELYKYIVHA